MKLRVSVLALAAAIPLLAFADDVNEDLLAASRKGDLAQIKALLEKGADVNAKSPYGDMFVVKAGPKFELLAKNPVGEPIMATPAIAKGMLVMRGEHHVFAVSEERTGREGASLKR